MDQNIEKELKNIVSIGNCLSCGKNFNSRSIIDARKYCGHLTCSLCCIQNIECRTCEMEKRMFVFDTTAKFLTNSFDEKIKRDIFQTLKIFKINKFGPKEFETCAAVLSNSNVFCSIPSKSFQVCYQLPALMDNKPTLVFSIDSIYIQRQIDYLQSLDISVKRLNYIGNTNFLYRLNEFDHCKLVFIEPDFFSSTKIGNLFQIVCGGTGLIGLRMME